MQTIFLSLTEILEIHQDQITRYGGESGIRDINLLKSAIAVPMTTFDGEFLHADIFEMAAAYLFHLAKNHPFVDGNKRVGAVAAIVFLALNGYEFAAPPGVLSDFVLAVASGETTKTGVAVFLHRYSCPR